jgi:uncharacterized repeat protein (TIGR03803 family)
MRMRLLIVCALAVVACNRAGASFQPPAVPGTEPMVFQPDTHHVIPFFEYKGGKNGGIKLSNYGGAAFIGDPQKALYSVAPSGGIDKCRRHYYWPGCGLVYELTPQKSSAFYKETILHTFDKTDGGVPDAALVMDKAGSLYGTTSLGSKYNDGNVFRLTPSRGGYTPTVLYSFKGGADGAAPAAPLILDDKGALYGTTTGSNVFQCDGSSSGSSKYCGTVFKLTPSGSRYTEKVLHAFLKSSKDGTSPEAGLTADAKGNLFGTTAAGGTGNIGTVFELTPAGSGEYTERILSNLEHGGDYPSSGVVEENGTFYGTTYFGGSGYCISFHFFFPPGCGVLYKVAPHGSGYVESVVHDFVKVSGGFFPLGLISGHDGFLYGTTDQGGYVKGRACRGGGSGYGYSPAGCGVIYRLRLSDGDFQVLYAFRDKTDGDLPEGGFPRSPLLDAGGVFYGTNTLGGAHNQGVGFALRP